MGSRVCRSLRAGAGVSFRVIVDAEIPDTISQQIRGDSFAFPPAYELMLALLQPGDVVIDLGAHVGTFSLAAAARGCRVIAVEASPDNVALLRASITENGFRDLSLVSAAAGDRSGTVRFIQAGPWGFVAKSATEKPTVEIPMVTIDDVVDERGVDRVDLIKLDIEGSEVAAVRGMARLLTRDDAPLVCYEANGHTLRLLGETPISLRAALTRFGYHHYRIDPGSLVPLEAGELQVDCNIDCIAARGSFRPPAGWRIRAPRTINETLSEILSASVHFNEDSRTYTARVLQELPDDLRSDPRVKQALRTLSMDPSPAVRAAAAWWRESP